MLVERYWASVARTLQIEAAGMNGLVPHEGERGRANELTLARLLANLLPPTIGVGSGIVINADGLASRQADIILYNRESQPQLIAQSLQLLFPVEVVFGVVEVKSRLSAADITDVGEKARRLRDLAAAPDSEPFFGVFAYEFADSDIGRARELVDLSGDQMPDLACVISPGFFLERAVRHGFVPLHERDQGLQAKAGTWEDPKGAAILVRDGVEYPAFSVTKWARKMSHVGDPGRALLLLASALLDRLAPISRNSSWIGNYLSSTAGELLWPDVD